MFADSKKGSAEAVAGDPGDTALCLILIQKKCIIYLTGKPVLGWSTGKRRSYEPQEATSGPPGNAHDPVAGNDFFRFEGTEPAAGLGGGI